MMKLVIGQAVELGQIHLLTGAPGPITNRHNNRGQHEDQNDITYDIHQYFRTIISLSSPDLTDKLTIARQ